MGDVVNLSINLLVTLNNKLILVNCRDVLEELLHTHTQHTQVLPALDLSWGLIVDV